MKMNEFGLPSSDCYLRKDVFATELDWGERYAELGRCITTICQELWFNISIRKRQILIKVFLDTTIENFE